MTDKKKESKWLDDVDELSATADLSASLLLIAERALYELSERRPVDITPDDISLIHGVEAIVKSARAELEKTLEHVNGKSSL